MRGRNFRVQCAAALVVVTLAPVISGNVSEIAVLFLCTALVLCLELINTTLEEVCDALVQDRSPHIKYIKDVAAGAVLVMALFSAAILAVLLVADGRWRTLFEWIAAHPWYGVLLGFEALLLVPAFIGGRK